MKYFLILTLILTLLLKQSCSDLSQKGLVHDLQSLHAAVQQAEPGEEIIMANGVSKDVETKFQGFGTKEKAITLTAEKECQVIIKGKSYLKLAGGYLIVSGLYFKNGSTHTRSVISY